MFPILHLFSKQKGVLAVMFVLKFSFPYKVIVAVTLGGLAPFVSGCRNDTTDAGTLASQGPRAGNGSANVRVASGNAAPQEDTGISMVILPNCASDVNIYAATIQHLKTKPAQFRLLCVAGQASGAKSLGAATDAEINETNAPLIMKTVYEVRKERPSVLYFVRQKYLTAEADPFRSFFTQVVNKAGYDGVKAPELAEVKDKPWLPQTQLSLSREFSSPTGAVEAGLWCDARNTCFKVHKTLKDPLEGVPQKVALVVAPHPDDEVIGAGGVMQHLIKEGFNVHVALVTDGNLGGSGAIRKQESKAGLSLLGVQNLHFLGANDGSVVAADPNLRGALAAVLAQVQPGIVFYPDGTEAHRDHKQSNALVNAAMQGVRAVPVVYESVAEVGAAINWNWCVPLSGTQFGAKMNAMAAHKSQLSDFPYDRLITGVATLRGVQFRSSTGYAECFKVQRFSGLLPE